MCTALPSNVASIYRWTRNRHPSKNVHVTCLQRDCMGGSRAAEEVIRVVCCGWRYDSNSLVVTPNFVTRKIFHKRARRPRAFWVQWSAILLSALALVSHAEDGDWGHLRIWWCTPACHFTSHHDAFLKRAYCWLSVRSCWLNSVSQNRWLHYSRWKTVRGLFQTPNTVTVTMTMIMGCHGIKNNVVNRRFKRWLPKTLHNFSPSCF